MSNKDIRVKCNNGVMVGYEDEGVLTFKGIPYAEQPVGNLRWRDTVAAADSDEEISCKEFGPAALQYEWPSEPASYFKKGEDCLSLNIWTNNTSPAKPKAVMVWIHGGSYCWGGSVDPIYNGHNQIRDYGDKIVFVSINYRLGIMAFPDFSDIPGGEEYTEINLAIRDQICALKWIQKNISKFGGDPNNVTIYGESAGAGSTGVHLYSSMSKGLFHKAIKHSPLPSLDPNDWRTRDDAKKFAKVIMEATGAKTMDELKAISAEELMRIDRENLISEFNSCNVVIDGEVLTEDLKGGLLANIKNGVVLMEGSNADEYMYMIPEYARDNLKYIGKPWHVHIASSADNDKTAVGYVSEDTEFNDVMRNFSDYIENFFLREYSKLSHEGRLNAKKFLDICRGIDEIAKKTEFRSDMLVRIPMLKESEVYADAGGKTYVYYWDVPSTRKEYRYSACHAVELSYVLNNTDDYIYAGAGQDEDVAKQIQEAWINFAVNGDPSTERNKWPQYNSDEQLTMVMRKERDGGWKVESCVLRKQKELMDKIYAESKHPGIH